LTVTGPRSYRSALTAVPPHTGVDPAPQRNEESRSNRADRHRPQRLLTCTSDRE
jgi:hypothetical protein